LEVVATADPLRAGHPRSGVCSGPRPFRAQRLRRSRRRPRWSQTNLGGKCSIV